MTADHSEKVLGLFPALDREQQQISLALYRLLAGGQPVSVDQLAAESNFHNVRIAQMLEEWPAVFYNDEHRVIGYWGLALPKMAHRFEVEDRALYTWCAWDSLFIPAILGKSARVESRCPETSTAIVLSVTPEGIADRQPTDIVMSFLDPEAAKIRENVMLHFCHYVHFFASPEAGSQWVSKHPGTYLLSIEEAHTLGRRKNEAQYQYLRDLK